MSDERRIMILAYWVAVVTVILVVVFALMVDNFNRMDRRITELEMPSDAAHEHKEVVESPCKECLNE